MINNNYMFKIMRSCSNP